MFTLLITFEEGLCVSLFIVASLLLLLQLLLRNTESVTTFKKLLDTAANLKNGTQALGCARIWFHRQH